MPEGSAKQLVDERPRIGVSACLLGQLVRYDGGHRRDHFVSDELARFVDLVPVCPEMDLGLGAPRPSMRLVRAVGGPRLVAARSDVDLTDEMRGYAERKAEEIARWELDGYVLKKDSPTCGLERVRVYAATGIPARDGRGIFAEALVRRHPLLPIEEEGRLRDLRLRENFLVRIFMHRRLAQLFDRAGRGRWRVGELVRFHAAAKLLLLAHSPEAYRALGRIVAGAADRPRAEVAAEYRQRALEALATVPSRGRHANVLEHLAGYLRKRASDDERAELRELIADYCGGLVPLAVPLTLIGHHVRRLHLRYLEQQLYLAPIPKQLLPGLAP